MTFSPTTSTLDDKTYCAVHPTVETGLKCNKCGRYMCVKCAVKTPVGYRCKQCVNQQQQGFYTATQADGVIAVIVSFIIGLPIGYILPRLGLFIIIIGAIPIGGFIGEIVHRAVGRRRGQYTWLFAVIGVVLATAVAFYFSPAFQAFLMATQANVRGRGEDIPTDFIVTALIEPILYVVLCAGALIARLRLGK
ncbi:MAG: hypothetical protein KF716_04630 [Anaerolineae bacterium]|nr:hypothetical protein [Anaerolineae bacterium]